MILPIVAGIVILVGIAAIVMSRFNWRWHTILITTLLLFANVTFFYLAARTLQIQSAYRGEINKYKKDIEAEEKTKKEYLEGARDFSGQRTSDERPETLDEFRTAYKEITHGRGRVIRGVSVRNTDATTGDISASVPQNADVISLPKGTTVFVFDEPKNAAAQGASRFLGEYRIAEVAERGINLTPLMPESKGIPTGNLALYEVPPHDNHESFSDLTDTELTNYIRGFPPEVQQMYRMDGKPVSEKQIKELNLPADQVWQEVKFLKQYASPKPNKTAAADPAQPADPAADGLAEDMLSEPSETANVEASIPDHFAVGETAPFDSKTAAELIANGTAEAVMDNGQPKKVFVRRLNDYPTAFRELRRQLAENQIKISEVDAQIAAVIKTTKSVESDIAAREATAKKLEADKAGFNNDANAAEAHAQALEKQLKETRTQIASVQQQIRTAAAEIRQLELTAADRINRQFPVPK
ncbi:MAG: hypothetical protein SGJ20_08450 [Planctomycetota bacterium]|nr:hypothetical protein [Planctomycetota bacterium]